MKSKKLSIEITIAIVAIQTVVIILLCFFASRDGSRVLKEKVMADMQVSARDRAAVVEQYITRCTEFLNDFSKSKNISETLEHPDDPDRMQKLQEYVDKYGENEKYLEDIYVCDMDTWVYAHTNPDSVHKYFREGNALEQLQANLKRSSKAYCAGIVMAPVTKEKVLSCYCAIRNESGECIGFTGAAFYMNSLADELDYLSYSSRDAASYALINVISNEYIFNSEDNHIGNYVNDDHLNAIMDQIRRNDMDITFQYEDGNVIASCFYMRDRNWLFVVSEDAAGIDYSIKQIRQKFIYISVLALIGLGLFCGFGIRFLLKPLSEIKNSIEDFTHNRLEKHQIITKYEKRKDEFGSLSRAVEMLREALQNKNEIYSELLKVQTVGVLAIKKKSEEIVLINDEAIRMFDLPSEYDADDTYDVLFAEIKEDERNNIKDMIISLRENGEETNTEIRHLGPDGKITYALSHGKIVKLISGEEVMVFSFTDITEKKQIENNLTVLSETDGLTGICNRRSGEEKIRLALDNGASGYFILFDANKFKYVNDTFGHRSGDEVLVAIAKTMEKTFRASDILVRFGGDEFVVFISEVTSDVVVMSVIERFLSNIDKIEIEGLKGHHISVSLGAVFCDGNKSLDECVKEADSVMYECKNQGGNAYRIASCKD